MRNFRATMAWSVRNGVVARLVRLYYTIVKLFSKTFKKTLDIFQIFDATRDDNKKSHAFSADD
jgi:hypothetical protein